MLVGVVCLAVLGVVSAPEDADATSVAQKRREAKRLQASIEETATRIEVLNEDFLDAQNRLKKFTSRASVTATAVTQAERDLVELRKRIRAQALDTYARPPGSQSDALRTSQDLNELERRSAYSQRASRANFDAQDALRASLLVLSERKTAATAAKSAVAVEVKTLNEKRMKAEVLLKEFEELEAQTRGELATLVKEAEESAAAAEAAAVVRAQKKRQEAAAAELARRRRETRERLQRGSRTGVGGTGSGDIPQISVPRPRTGDPLPGQIPDLTPSRQSDAELEIEAGSAPSIPTSPGAAAAVRLALAQLGKPYVWAADGPNSFDCSGLMLFAWRAGGANLPHSSRAQFATTTRVSISQIRPGDLVFFGRPIHHVGMYVGDGKMVEASRSGRPVKFGSIHRKDRVGIGRVR